MLARAKARPLLHRVSVIVPTLKPCMLFSSCTSLVPLTLCYVWVQEPGHGVSSCFFALLIFGSLSVCFCNTVVRQLSF